MVARRRKRAKKEERPGDKYIRQFKKGIRQRGQSGWSYPADPPPVEADPPFAAAMPEFPAFFGTARPRPGKQPEPRPLAIEEEERLPLARQGQPIPLPSEEPAEGRQPDSPPEMICPLHGEPCLGPHCAWFDGISQCSITNLVENTSRLIGQISGLKALIEYVSKVDE